MDSLDVIDDVNALLKLGVGDPYRLEHIKQAYIQDKTIWQSDSNYLQQMKEKYLTKHSDVQTETDENSENDAESKNLIHCWKCGKKVPLASNFCMICGSAVFEVGTEPQIEERQRPPINLKNKTKTIGLKIPIMIGIPVLILIILGVGYSQGFFDNALENQISNESIEDEIVSKSAEKVSSETNSKCGKGTIFDPNTNSCVLESEVVSVDKEPSSSETNSKCGAGTVFDTDTNSCILDK